MGKSTPAVHAIVGGYNKYRCNARSVKLNKRSVSLSKGDSFRIKAKVKGVKTGIAVLTHAAALRYYSSDRNVAIVSDTGRIKARGKGTCRIYVLANNGVRASIKVKVK